MNLVNEILTHKMFGKGRIIKHQDNYISVSFEIGEKTFVYPSAFESFLTLENKAIHGEVLNEIKIQKDTQAKIKAEEIAKQQQKSVSIPKQQNYKKPKKYPRSNVAFKCNYCDGGASSQQVGFSGVCSDKMMDYNINIANRVWCGSDNSQCLRYLNGEITRDDLEGYMEDNNSVCYESQMLNNWAAFAGIVQTGERKGQPMKLHEVQCNSLAVLTTREPYAAESDRFIFAVFLVDENYEGDSQEEGYVTTNSEYKIKLSSKEAKQMLFWNYHCNDNKPEMIVWSSGLHRYFEDEQAAQILKDIMLAKKGTKDEELAKRFFEHFCKINNVDINLLPKTKGALSL